MNRCKYIKRMRWINFQLSMKSLDLNGRTALASTRKFLCFFFFVLFQIRYQFGVCFVSLQPAVYSLFFYVPDFKFHGTCRIRWVALAASLSFLLLWQGAVTRTRDSRLDLKRKSFVCHQHRSTVARTSTVKSQTEKSAGPTIVLAPNCALKQYRLYLFLEQKREKRCHMACHPSSVVRNKGPTHTEMATQEEGNPKKKKRVWRKNMEISFYLFFFIFSWRAHNLPQHNIFHIP